VTDHSDESNDPSKADTPVEVPRGGRVDVLKMLRDAVLSGEASATTAAQAELKGRWSDLELEEMQKNASLQRIAIVVHSLRRIIDEEAAVLNALPDPIHTLVVDMKLAADSTDDALVALGL
jgi:hypothetical protein